MWVYLLQTIKLKAFYFHPENYDWNQQNYDCHQLKTKSPGHSFDLSAVIWTTLQNLSKMFVLVKYSLHNFITWRTYYMQTKYAHNTIHHIVKVSISVLYILLIWQPALWIAICFSFKPNQLNNKEVVSVARPTEWAPYTSKNTYLAYLT